MVEHFDRLAHPPRGFFPAEVRRSTLSVQKKLSTQALSQQLALRPMEEVINATTGCAARWHRRSHRLGGRLADRSERPQEALLEGHGLWPETCSLTPALSWRCLAAATPTTTGRGRRRRARPHLGPRANPFCPRTFHLLGTRGAPLCALLRRRAVLVTFNLANELEPVLKLTRKYANVPMSLADACLVRMSEILPDPVILTTNTDFRIYRRHGRHVVPAVTPT